MSVSVVLALACVVLLVIAVLLAVVGFRRLRRARGVRRVRVPATLVSQTYAGAGDVLHVEYPAPDGTPLRATIYMWLVNAPGVPYTFDGTVWVDPADPTDVTPRRQGRTTWATVTLILAAIALVGAIGTGIASAVVAFAESFPT
ncbi:hypothetical protein [Cellulomonas wangsupingiae]|uniref:DUF3592 domain-containing protein n=1 Tax=Cellulomonas wangsupingiae TaxID=2968085 RepID=A0ABY5K3V0_9CELL|nr:hypothetical protein [Cellulomonas wangsupingiae]MCC2333753.1 hypothetical protein [Cellulomonas wangsupingiae]MCM0639428.1 hypothetical protein [Cellulomonas wangsupingiae]UUI65015.1 hypothetical protein NP075_18190 [Cellulomonas wangsupingiae]